ncbi:MAG: hypothetical protein WCY11_16470 [Novosphingobium sp.]
MSESDKTRQKLVDTIRKTREGSAENPAASAAASAEKKPVAKKAPAKPKRAASAQPEPHATTQVKSDSARTTADPYQSARRRVWPD